VHHRNFIVDLSNSPPSARMQRLMRDRDDGSSHVQGAAGAFAFVNTSANAMVDFRGYAIRASPSRSRACCDALRHLEADDLACAAREKCGRRSPSMRRWR